MQTQPAIRPSAAPPAPGMTSLPVRIELDTGAVITAAASRKLMEGERLVQERVSLAERVAAFVNPRRLNADGSIGTINPHDIPRYRENLTPTQAQGELIEFNKHLAKLREEASALERALQIHYDKPAELARQRTVLRDLERQDSDIRADALLDNKLDGELDERRAAIYEQRALCTRLEKEAELAEKAYAKGRARDLQPLLETIRSMEQRIPKMQRQALLEMLTFEADTMRRAYESAYNAAVIVFGITRALAKLSTTAPGDTFGNGLQAHLTLPTPNHPSFVFRSVPDIHGDVEAQAVWLLEQLSGL
jgi:hypothetical protein